MRFLTLLIVFTFLVGCDSSDESSLSYSPDLATVGPDGPMELNYVMHGSECPFTGEIALKESSVDSNGHMSFGDKLEGLVISETSKGFYAEFYDTMVEPNPHRYAADFLIIEHHTSTVDFLKFSERLCKLYPVDFFYSLPEEVQNWPDLF